MKLTLQAKGPLKGTIKLPGDKSISHRAILLGAMADGESQIKNILAAGVTRVMLNALRQLGINWELEGTTLRIQGKGIKGFTSSSQALNCGNSATTMRLLAGGLSAGGVEAVLDGSEGLRKRPMKRIIDPLQKMGVEITGSSKNTAPITLKIRKDTLLKGTRHELSVASAQVKSAILLAGLDADSATTVVEPGPSRDHTERMLNLMGAKVKINQNEIILQPAQKLAPLDITIPGDISSGAFLISAALTVPGSEILLKNIGLNPTRMGFVHVLQQIGANITISSQREENNEPLGDILVKYSELSGIEIGGETVVLMIDEFLAFSIAAVYAQGETIVRDAKELRFKETDRIKLLCQEFGVLGVEIEELEDGFVIQGSKGFEGGPAQGHGDHRLAMALSLLGLGANRPVSIDGAEIIEESFPEFADSMQSLGVGVIWE